MTSRTHFVRAGRSTAQETMQFEALLTMACDAMDDKHVEVAKAENELEGLAFLLIAKVKNAQTSTIKYMAMSLLGEILSMVCKDDDKKAEKIRKGTVPSDLIRAMMKVWGQMSGDERNEFLSSDHFNE